MGAMGNNQTAVFLGRALPVVPAGANTGVPMPDTDELKKPQEMDDRMVEKITQRYKNLGGGSNTANLIKERYERKRAALSKFSEKVKKGEPVIEADLNALREAGVSEDEIRQLKPAS